MEQSSIPFPILINQLSDPRSQRRLQAIKEIMRRRAEREQAFASLLALLRDPDIQVYKATITALGASGNQQAAPVLTHIVTQHPLATVRLCALKALARISPSQAMPHVLTALRDSNALVRRAAVKIVGRQNNPQMAQMLEPLLEDTRAIVRASATKVLKQLGNAQTVDPSRVTVGKADAYNNRGRACRASGLYEQARSDFSQAIQLEPDHAEAYRNRGLLYYLDLRQYEQAIDDFDRYLQLKPDDMEFYFQRGSTYVQLRRYDEAVADLDRVLASNPGRYLETLALLNRGVTHLRQQAYQQALADYDEVVALDPAKAHAYNGRGCCYHFLGDYQQAIIEYDQAIELNPAYGLYYSNRGEAYLSLAQFDQAIADFELALVLKPDLPDTRDYLKKARLERRDALQKGNSS